MAYRSFQIGLTLRLLTNKGREGATTTFCKKYGKWFLQLAVYGVIFTLFLTDSRYNDDYIFRLWIFVELATFFIEPFYFVLISRNLKMTIDQTNDFQKKYVSKVLKRARTLSQARASRRKKTGSIINTESGGSSSSEDE